MAELESTIAIILAAGCGRRMGTPKALMRIDGEPWWVLQQARLRSIGVDSLWVVSETVDAQMTGDDRAPERRLLADSQAPMMASILAGVRALAPTPPSGVFILPIDTPAPGRAVWTDCATTDAVAAPLFHDRGGHPVYLPWSWIAEHLLDDHVDPATARLDQMIAGSIHRIDTDDPDCATNLNRPADLDHWLQRNRSNFVNSASTTNQPDRTDPDFLAVARGDAPADLLLTGGRIIDVCNRRIIENASVAIKGARIAGVGDYTEATEVIDLAGAYIAPGLIDAHMHVESTMMLPSEFVRVSAPHGTTGVVLDPHEIANVLGIEGIRLLMDDARGLPMDMMFAASSCVPSAPLETSGAVLSADDLAPLFDDDRIVALAEMMNFPGVVNAVPDVLEKVRLGLNRRIVDGHCPGLGGLALQAYVAAGVSSDHECTSADEALEKTRAGMQVYIREGSAARNVEALLPAVTPENAHRFCLCTDDRHPGDLLDEGHIDHVVRKAVRQGLDPITAIAMGSLHVADHYRRPDIGAITPGRFADLIIFDSLEDIRPNRVYFRGSLVARDGVFTGTIAPNDTRQRARALGGGVTLPAGLNIDSFRISATPGANEIRIIGMDPHQLLTAHLIEPANVVDGEHRVDLPRDILKIAVIERHRGSGNMGLGFVKGFGFDRGAIASTIGHDAHNIVVVGTNDADMLTAARALEALGGGQCVVLDGQTIATLALPIAGLMSDKPAQELIEEQANLLKALPRIGCELHDPFMPLSFLPLPVIPSLKISDFGLVDVDRFEVTTLEV